ncbi:hypothetical protein [Nocardiopsis ansamitocini]|uniref:Uncharacterized protein n=1 Tax=Nocardiopsis ansamitocini TaxID=1670832 RepID=A0A9W6PA87_9ACTN|nr:hypothetical protein [Nocardiopsis ansamitocini]GLU49858.1 hypothetical protein Nans01_42090 [Nocardiopsis ansamitocini]
MASTWLTKPLGSMTANELAEALAVLERTAPDDTALRTALRRELSRAAGEDWMFDVA